MSSLILDNLRDGVFTSYSSVEPVNNPQSAVVGASTYSSTSFNHVLTGDSTSYPACSDSNGYPVYGYCIGIYVSGSLRWIRPVSVSATSTAFEWSTDFVSWTRGSYTSPYPAGLWSFGTNYGVASTVYFAGNNSDGNILALSANCNSGNVWDLQSRLGYGSNLHICQGYGEILILRFASQAVKMYWSSTQFASSGSVTVASSLSGIPIEARLCCQGLKVIISMGNVGMNIYYSERQSTTVQSYSTPQLVAINNRYAFQQAYWSVRRGCFYMVGSDGQQSEVYSSTTGTSWVSIGGCTSGSTGSVYLDGV